MALKHLLLAAELMRGGMPLSEISEIIKMQDVPTPEEDPDHQQDNPAPEQDTPDPEEDPTPEQDNPAPEQPAPDPKPQQPKPLNRPEQNQGGANLIDELNKLF